MGGTSGYVAGTWYWWRGGMLVGSTRDVASTQGNVWFFVWFEYAGFQAVQTNWVNWSTGRSIQVRWVPTRANRPAQTRPCHSTYLSPLGSDPCEGGAFDPRWSDTLQTFWGVRFRFAHVWPGPFTCEANVMRLTLHTWHATQALKKIDEFSLARGGTCKVIMGWFLLRYFCFYAYLLVCLDLKLVHVLMNNCNNWTPYHLKLIAIHKIKCAFHKL